jgi:hypothetical protein
MYIPNLGNATQPSGAPKPNQVPVDPYKAASQEIEMKDLFYQEYNEFLELAYGSTGSSKHSGTDNGSEAAKKPNIWLAIMYFSTVVMGGFMDYQGSEMNMESAMLDTVSVLNGDLSHIQSDLNTIIQNMNTQNTSSTATSNSISPSTSDVKQFVNDTYQYYEDLNYYFVDKGSPFSGTSGTQLYNTIKGDFNTYDNAFSELSSGNISQLVTALTTQFATDYNGASSSSGTSDYGSGLKDDQDVLSNAETTQNQQSSSTQVNLSSDQQTYNSYEGTMKNILQMINKQVQGSIQAQERSS